MANRKDPLKERAGSPRYRVLERDIDRILEDGEAPPTSGTLSLDGYLKVKPASRNKNAKAWKQFDMENSGFKPTLELAQEGYTDVSKDFFSSDALRAWIQEVPTSIDNQKLRSALAKYCDVSYVDINRRKRCAFVNFGSMQALEIAIANNPYEIGGHSLFVEYRHQNDQDVHSPLENSEARHQASKVGVPNLRVYTGATSLPSTSNFASTHAFQGTIEPDTSTTINTLAHTNGDRSVFQWSSSARAYDLIGRIKAAQVPLYQEWMNRIYFDPKYRDENGHLKRKSIELALISVVKKLAQQADGAASTISSNSRSSTLGNLSQDRDRNEDAASYRYSGSMSARVAPQPVPSHHPASHTGHITPNASPFQYRTEPQTAALDHYDKVQNFRSRDKAIMAHFARLNESSSILRTGSILSNFSAENAADESRYLADEQSSGAKQPAAARTLLMESECLPDPANAPDVAMGNGNHTYKSNFSVAAQSSDVCAQLATSQAEIQESFRGDFRSPNAAQTSLHSANASSHQTPTSAISFANIQHGRSTSLASHVSVPNVNNSVAESGWRCRPVPVQVVQIPNLSDDELREYYQSQPRMSINGPYFLHEEERRVLPRYEEQLENWWISGTRNVERQEQNAKIHLAAFPPKSGDKQLLKDAEVATKLFIFLYDHLASYIRGPVEIRRLGTRYVDPPAWCFDKSVLPDREKTFFDDDSIKLPQRFGRDPRYRHLTQGGLPRAS